MSRPLIYDDQFTSLVHSNVKQKIFFCFPIKVQSTAFYQSMSLQNAIRICSIYDFIFGFFILYCAYPNFSILEFILLFLSIAFGVISMGMSNNFNKRYSKYYYYWRVIITFIIPIIEFFEYNSKKICYYSNCNQFTYYFGLSLGLTIIHIYLTKIAWSFSTRLLLGQELLIIHGKYLELMLNKENSLINNMSNNQNNQNKKNEMDIF